MNSTRPQCPPAPGTTFRPAHDWNTIRNTTPLMYSTRTDIHSRSSIDADFAGVFDWVPRELPSALPVFGRYPGGTAKRLREMALVGETRLERNKRNGFLAK